MAASRPMSYHETFQPTPFDDGNAPVKCTGAPKSTVSAFSHVGGRKTQEDRLMACPKLVPDLDRWFMVGVFDGTVGDFASDNVQNLVMPSLLESPQWPEVVKAAPGNGGIPDKAALSKALVHTYIESDRRLIQLCADQKKDYASCTSVTAAVFGSVLAVAHLGDSRIALGSIAPHTPGGQPVGEFLTVDHKPDAQSERMRIESQGGSVEYLKHHNNKPFIRGGDFTARKALGERPMQLQYSRAFGGKDLKMFGLSAEPDVRLVDLTPAHRVLILASDGLWDVFNANEAVQIAWQAHMQQRSPSEAVVNSAIFEQQRDGVSSDNVTAVVLIFDWP